MSECQRAEGLASAWRTPVENLPYFGIPTHHHTYCFDLDGTICTQEAPECYHRAEPRPRLVETIRRLKAAGHTIAIYTARAPSKGGDPTALTVDQLRAWGVPYDRLHFGKPAADRYIDDRSMTPDEFLTCLGGVQP